MIVRNQFQFSQNVIHLIIFFLLKSNSIRTVEIKLMFRDLWLDYMIMNKAHDQKKYIPLLHPKIRYEVVELRIDLETKLNTSLLFKGSDRPFDSNYAIEIDQFSACFLKTKVHFEQEKNCALNLALKLCASAFVQVNRYK